MKCGFCRKADCGECSIWEAGIELLLREQNRRRAIPNFYRDNPAFNKTRRIRGEEE